MSIFSVGGGNAADDFELEQSLRFEEDDASKLSRTFTSAGNRKTWTLSTWVKLSGLDTTDHGELFNGYDSGSDTGFTAVYWYNGKLRVAGWGTTWRETSQEFRDPSAWYHLVVAFDTTESAADDRCKIYVNGSQVTAFGTNNALSQDTDYGINGAWVHQIGQDNSASSSRNFSGYMGEFHFIDGTALTPASFGETDTITNQWVPIEVTGMTYGTNGFYLPFSSTELTNSFTDSHVVSSQTAFTPTETLTCDILLVGGGGSGGNGMGGGGGAGQVRTLTGQSMSATSHAVTIGYGGNNTNAIFSVGSNGGTTSLGSLPTAIGGGGGGSYDGNSGLGGASGGGGGGREGNGVNNVPGGSGTAGNPGGHGTMRQGGVYRGQGGGGGAGAAGGNGSQSGPGGAGGDGVTNDYRTGSPVYYGGGGGGADYSDYPGGAGGQGGGGRGPTSGGASDNLPGTANTGGGGGGGALNKGGAGGSGIVVIRYASSTAKASGGTITSYTSGPTTYQVHTFTDVTHTITANGDVANTRGTNLGTTFKVIDSYTSTGSHTWTCPSGITSIEVLTVAGGGGGAGYYGGGGGGAGGIVHQTDYTVVPGTVYDLTVGAGGAADPGATAQGNDGSDSVWNVNAEGSGLTHTAKGGGGGGGYANPPGPDGRPGGSGGGSNSRYGNQPGNAGDGGSSTQASFSGATSYGNVGGSNSTTHATESAGSGGGGAGQAGNVTRSAGSPSADQGGTGGNGVYFSTFASYGVSGYFGGGGGGGGGNTSGPRDGGDGGTGGGGHGGTHNTTAAGNGTANTGGGGGGASQHNSSPGSTGGGGGSGVILIAYDKSKPGQSSVEFDGTGDYLTSPHNSDWGFGTGDFTLEMWLRFANKKTGSGAAGANALIANHNSPNGWQWIYRGSDNTFELWSTDQDEYASSFTLNNDTWYQVAVTRDGNTLRHYVDGVQCGSNAFTETMSDTSTTLQIGSYDQSGLGLIDGYMDEIRISDTCRYPDGTTFTPSTTAFTADSNTKLLIHSDFNGGLGADNSGNKNDYSVTNILVTDQLPDSPTNNFCTLNPLDQRGTLTLSEGNLTVTSSSSDPEVRATIEIPQSGKWYWEFLMQYSTSFMIGVVDQTVSGNPYGSNQSVLYSSGLGTKYNFSSVASYGATWTTGDLMGIAFNRDDNEITFYKNNSAQPTLTIGGTAAQQARLVPVFATGTGGTGGGTVNFGQDSSFAGAVTAQGNQDGNGKGDFYYTPPSGSLALCSDNIPDVSIADPTAHFNTAIWSGNDTYPRTIDVGFDPGLVWGKSRTDSGTDHYLLDSVRTFANGKALSSNATNAEGVKVANVNINGTTSTGFTMAATSGYDTQNKSGQTYVAWNWKAGGTAVSNTDGTITSSVSANPTAGFSIVSFTGNGTAGATVGHGLSQAPEFWVTKNRDSAYAWFTGTPEYPNPAGNYYIQLDATQAASSNTGIWNGTLASSSVITLGNLASAQNNSGDAHIAYCFHSVDGYSKIGSYTGNGSSDGPMIYTGFRPAFVLLKISSASNDWILQDNKRDTYNAVGHYLRPNTNDAELDEDSIDFLSNGFKLRTTSGARNTSSGTHIYLAFAESPFKTANAR